MNKTIPEKDETFQDQAINEIIPKKWEASKKEVVHEIYFLSV